jgi:tetratricopeptide (TPR) repeat protein
MRGLQTEYVLKGIYLGLLLFVALHVRDGQTTGIVAGCLAGGLVLALAVAAVQKLRQGYRIRGRLLPFLLLLLLESPGLVYAGILLGTAGAAFYVRSIGETPDDWSVLSFAAGGALLGIVFSVLKRLQQRMARVLGSLALAAALVAGALALFGHFGDLDPNLKRFELTPLDTTFFSILLLIGIPFFYLLAFSGREEESEVEIGAMCAALGLSLWMLVHDQPKLIAFRSLGFLVPVLLYFFYTLRVLPGLRIFKHALRGISFLQVGRFRLSLLSFRRALQLDPRNKLAREGLWNVHRTIDVAHLPNDPELLAIMDFDLCLDRAGTLLLNPGPTPAQLQEANRLLDLVVSQRPEMRPRTQYWRAVAFTHGRQYERAAHELAQVLDPAEHSAAEEAQRRAVLLQAWQLALTLHDELRRRVGLPQLAQPGRRMEAILAVERHLAANPDNRGVWPLKQLLYHDVTEADYDAAAGGPDLAVPHFDHGYVQQLGLAQINDSVRWQRGGDYLRIAARGLPATGPTIFFQIAEANQRAGNAEGAWHNYELVKRAGRAVGPKNLPDADRQAYFATLKMLADEALARNDLDAAIENYQLFTESERSGLETLRTLADLYERKGDPLHALRATEQALIYNLRDKDLLERKDKYYYSVTPEDLGARLDVVRGGFDTTYCLSKARSLLEVKNADLDLVDWAQHLVTLVRVVQPENMKAGVLLARALLRRGEIEQAVQLLEGMRAGRPEQFATSDDEEAWYAASRLLGDLYLQQLGKPDLAVPCYNDFRKCSKSGADTIFKLGQAYEQIGDRPRAKRCYEQVTAYDNHPLAYEARDALSRMQAN